MSNRNGSNAQNQNAWHLSAHLSFVLLDKVIHNIKKEPLESEIAKIKNRGNIIFPGKITEYDS